VKVSIHLELSTPAGRMDSLPRIEILGHNVRQSKYRIFRAAESSVELTEIPPELDPMAVKLTTAERFLLLEQLQIGVAEFLVPPSLIRGVRVPLKWTLGVKPAIAPKQFSISLGKGAIDWLATVSLEWPQTSQVDFGVIDIPVDIRDSIVLAGLECVFRPHLSSDRCYLCIPLQSGRNQGNTIQFSFPIVASKRLSAVELPELVLIGSQPIYPEIRLPQELAGQRLSWNEPTSQWRDNLNQWVESDQSWVVQAKPGRRDFVMSAQTKSADPCQLLFQWFQLTYCSANQMTAISHFWIQPNNQPQVFIDIPKRWEVLGVESGDQTISWTVTDESLKIQMPSTNFPIAVRLIVRAAGDHNGGISLPKIQAMEVPGHQSIISLPKGLDWSIDGSPLPSQVLLGSWARQVVSVMQATAGLSQRQSAIWLSSWNPQLNSISLQDPVDGTESNPEVEAYDSDEDGTVVAGELWHAATFQVDNDQQELELEAASRSFNFFKLEDSSESRLRSVSPRSLAWQLSNGWQIPLAILLFVTGYFGWRQYSQAIERFVGLHQWAGWLAFALLLSVTLPTVVPSLVVLGISIWLGVGHFRDYRKQLRNLV
jgi:hypothetical protein